jgi:hypothetical protein
MRHAAALVGTHSLFGVSVLALYGGMFFAEAVLKESSFWKKAVSERGSFWKKHDRAKPRHNGGPAVRAGAAETHPKNRQGSSRKKGSKG